MKILFWIGYATPNWDKGTWMNEGMGGSEYCVIKLADYLDLNGCDVTISGDVKTGNWHGGNRKCLIYHWRYVVRLMQLIGLILILMNYQMLIGKVTGVLMI